MPHPTPPHHTPPMSTKHHGLLKAAVQLVSRDIVQYPRIYVGWWFGTFFNFHIGNVIIPTDEHIFQRGRSTTNQLFNRDTMGYSWIELYSWICWVDVNFRNSWGVLVFKVGGLCIRLGSVDGHWNWYGGYTDLDNEVEHEIKITINPTGQCLPACPCRTYGLIVVLIYIWYMFPCSVRRCLSACFLFL